MPTGRRAALASFLSDHGQKTDWFKDHVVTLLLCSCMTYNNI